jgi:uncharacterized membrane protein YhaH (DUF805 family)
LGFRNYVNFSGGATRSEFWYWVLFVLLVGTLTQNTETLNSAFGLLTFVPRLAVCVRRLHDLDRTGWWMLIWLTVFGFFCVDLLVL